MQLDRYPVVSLQAAGEFGDTSAQEVVVLYSHGHLARIDHGLCNTRLLVAMNVCV